MSRRRNKPRRWRADFARRALAPVLLLAFAYLAAQAVAATHDLGPEGHPAGEICAICVTLGSLAAGDVAPLGTAIAPRSHETAAAPGLVLTHSLAPAAYEARAPPAAS